MRFEVVLAGLTMAILSGCSIGKFEHTRTEHQSLAPANLEVVEVSTFNGAVNITAHDSAEVEVQIDYSARGDSEEAAAANCETLGCHLSDENGRLVLNATRPANDYSSAAAMTLKVPRYCRVEVQTSNGAVSVEGFSGDVDLTSSNGRIRAENIEGAIDLETSNGRIEIVGCTGPIDVSTSNGRVEFDGNLTGQDNQISTSNGSVQVMLPSDALVAVTAETSNGKVACSTEHAVIKQDDDYLKAIVGSGASTQAIATAALTIGSSNGSIDVGAVSAADVSESKNN
ncbi:MAG: DUF4097 family beta strand repeat-containing protein [Fuerstiella sp.]